MYFKAGYFVVSSVLFLSAANQAHTPSPEREDARPKIIKQQNHKGEAWAFFLPSWKQPSRELASPGLGLERWLGDPLNRIEPEFKVPASLRERVHFWANVYAAYPSDVRIVHDRDDLGFIYGRLDLTSLRASAKSRAEWERRSSKMERQMVRNLAEKLREVFRPRSKTPSAESVAIRRWLLARGISSSAELEKRIKAIRVQRGQREVYLLALSRSRRWLPEMESVFEERGLPRGLTRIPFVESSFHVGAQSKVRAMGLWQFMPRTAKELIHLKDKKKWSDPMLQTEAAARLLQRSRRALPDWGTTVTAYNSGDRRILKLLKKHRVRTIEGLIDASKGSAGLGFAGENFFAEVLAANLLEAYQDRWLPVLSGQVVPFAIAFEELLPPKALACEL